MRSITIVTLLIALGMGEKFDPATLKDLSSGGYGLMPAQVRHFAMSKTPATIQVHGVGPFALNYVNTADDPRTAAAAK